MKRNDADPTILFIMGKILPNSAQGIRYSYLIQQIKLRYKISILTFSSFLSKDERIKEISILKHRIKIVSNDKKKLIKNAVRSIIHTLFFPDRFKIHLPKYKDLIKKEMDSNTFDLIIIGMTPFSLYSLTSWIKKNYSIPICIDLSDPFSGNALHINNRISHLRARKYELRYLKYVDKIVVLNEKIKDYYVNKLGISRGIIKVIEQGVADSALELPEQKIKIQENNSLKLIYAGGFYKNFREPFELYKSINLCKKDIILSVYGNIRSNFLPPQSNSIIYKGSLTQEELFQQYLKNDLLVFIDNFKGIQVPGKTIELMLLQIPVLFIYENEESPTLDYVNKNPYVLKVKNKASEIAQLLENTDFENIKYKPSYIDSYKRFTWHNLAERYKEFIES